MCLYFLKTFEQSSIWTEIKEHNPYLSLQGSLLELTCAKLYFLVSEGFTFHDRSKHHIVSPLYLPLHP